jgi:hypothetical protein
MLSKLEQFNWAILFRRAVWTGVYIAMFGLIILMSQSLSDKQPVLFAIILLAAFVGSIGLVYSRRSFQTGAWLTGIAALMLGIGGIVVHTILETSYWSSTIEQINADFQRENAVMEARDVVSEKRRERYASLAGVRTSSQLSALIEKEKLNPIWTRSKGCTEVTLPDSRKFCDSYFDLVVEHEGAKDAGNLEAVVWGAATDIETKVNRNIASAAILAQRIFGGSVYDWTGVIVAVIVGFTQLLLALSLYVGYAPEKHRQIAPAIIIPRKPYTPSLTLPVKPEMQKAAESLQKDPEPPAPAPSPDGGGTPVAEPEAKPDGIEPEPTVTAELYDFPAKEPPRTKKQRKHALREKQDRERSQMIGDFVYECLDVKSDAASLTKTKSKGYASGGTRGTVVYDAFVNWCHRNGAEVIDHSPFGRLIKQYVDTAKAVKGVYYGAVIRATVAKRKAA